MNRSCSVPRHLMDNDLIGPSGKLKADPASPIKLPLIFAFWLWVTLSIPAYAAPSVSERYGNVYYSVENGITRQITKSGNFGEPVLSPDGRTIAFIHIDGMANSDGEGVFTSLWVADGQTGQTRKLLGPREDQDPKLNLASFQHPRFSLDGGYIYIDADAWATSSAVHQINIKTGVHRFVIDGWTMGVLRTGPFRGYLLVGRHRYHPAPAYGSFNPVYVVRPDGHETFMVPDSDKDDGERSLPAWLREKGWKAW